jgi:hypothetical protein
MPAPSRREFLRVGGGSLLGLGLADLLRAEALPRPLLPLRPGFGRAKSVVLIFLQGGPSHLDLWDPKDDVPADVKSPFATIRSKVPGMELTELLPRVAEVTDRLTLIRSMSYTPDGLFNHTAAHYQMLTGYTADRVSPSGQLEPPSPKDFPNFGAHIVRLRPPEVAMLPFVQLPRPLQESNVIARPAPPASSAGPSIRTPCTRPATTSTRGRWTGSRSATWRSVPNSRSRGSSAAAGCARRSTRR